MNRFISSKPLIALALLIVLRQNHKSAPRPCACRSLAGWQLNGMVAVRLLWWRPFQGCLKSVKPLPKFSLRAKNTVAMIVWCKAMFALFPWWTFCTTSHESGRPNGVSVSWDSCRSGFFTSTNFAESHLNILCLKLKETCKTTVLNNQI